MSFIMALVSGWILNKINHVPYRKVYSIVIGVIIQLYMYGIGELFLLQILGFITCFFFVLFSYFTMKCSPRNLQHKIVFVVNAFLLSLVHIHKKIYYKGFWGADITSVLMMNLCRLTAVSICYRDGMKIADKTDKELRTSMSNKK